MSAEPRPVVAVAVYSDSCERLPDGSLLIHDCSTTAKPRRLVAKPEDIAPWPDAERLAAAEARIAKLEAVAEAARFYLEHGWRIGEAADLLRDALGRPR